MTFWLSHYGNAKYLPIRIYFIQSNEIWAYFANRFAFACSNRFTKQLRGIETHTTQSRFQQPTTVSVVQPCAVGQWRTRSHLLSTLSWRIMKVASTSTKLRWFAVSNVYETIRPVTYLLKPLGIWSSGWNPRSKSQWKSWHSWFYVAFFLAINVYATLAAIHIQQFNNVDNSLIIRRSVYCFSLTMFGTATYSILCSWLARKKIEALLKNLHDVDGALFNMKTQLDHQGHHFKIVFGLVGGLLASIALTVASYEIYANTVPWFRYTLTSILTFIVTLGYFTVNMMAATTLNLLLVSRLQALNDCFRWVRMNSYNCIDTLYWNSVLKLKIRFCS